MNILTQIIIGAASGSLRQTHEFMASIPKHKSVFEHSAPRIGSTCVFTRPSCSHQSSSCLLTGSFPVFLKARTLSATPFQAKVAALDGAATLVNGIVAMSKIRARPAGILVGPSGGGIKSQKCLGLPKSPCPSGQPRAHKTGI